MSYARARRHHRAARRENTQRTHVKNGVFITKQKRNGLVAMAVVMIITGFIKGMVIGNFLGKKSWKGCNL